MNNLKLILSQARTVGATSRELLSATTSDDHSYATRFMIAVSLIDSIGSFVRREVENFIEIVSFRRVDGCLIERVRFAAEAIAEQLEDIVMLHVDEPDGSFIAAIRSLVDSHDKLVEAMQEVLAELQAGPTDAESTNRIVLQSAA